MLELKNKGALWLGKFKGGRKYFLDSNNEVCYIECACCREIKHAKEFHSNHFKKFNKQNYCIACNEKRLSGKIKGDKRQKRQEVKPITPITPAPISKQLKTEPVFIYLIPFGGSKIYIGRTKNISKRMATHIDRCKRGIHSSRYIQNKYNESPEEVIKKFNTPLIIYVNLVGNRELAGKVEREYIDHYIDKGFMVLGGKY